MLAKPIAHRVLQFLGPLALLAGAAVPASARVGLIVGEPFGAFGTMMPAGHAAVYLQNICVDTPTHLRSCNPGELGSVVSRYHDLRQPALDWIAMPAFPFFYGVDNVTDVPRFVTPAVLKEIRENYRQAHLRDVAPNRSGGRAPKYGDWQEGIGATFDRRLYLYTLDSTAEQDATILARLNGDANHRRYTLFSADCGDFAAEILAPVLPGVLHPSKLADFHMTSPKVLAREFDTYAQQHPELHPAVAEIPQLPGSTRRSRPLRGAAETLIKTKRYLATLLVIQPEVPLASWIIYETKGKWTPGLDARAMSPADWMSPSASPQRTAVAQDATRANERDAAASEDAAEIRLEW